MPGSINPNNLFDVSISRHPEVGHWLDDEQLLHWARNALQGQAAGAAFDLRITNGAEMRDLNARFRHVDSATNVLAFPADPQPWRSTQHLGDVVLCVPVIENEAEAQGKTAPAHAAHMVTHGVLHLLGFDHEEPAEAQLMEAEEVRLLKQLGLPDPYG